ncbi:MAG TPA: hypothetical protein VFZ48_00850 [Candidatus Saccharimonadales bacterium]
MKGIIYEGTSGIGKTTAIRNLRQQIAVEQHDTTTLFISEHHSYQTLARKKNGDTPTVASIKKHFADLADSLEVFHTHYEQSLLAERGQHLNAIVILERMVLSHCAFMTIDPTPFEQEVRRMAGLNLQLIIMHLDPAEVRSRLAHAMEIRTGEGWFKHVDELGGFDATVKYYIEWQKRLLTYSKQVEGWIPTHYIDMAEPQEKVNAFLRTFVMAQP